MNIERSITSQQDRTLELSGSDPTSLTIQPLAQRSMFWRPAYLESSALLEHIPFAFWLVEAQRPEVLVELGTHYGVSYFAFCQAVEKLGLGTRCFAIDHWKNDDQTGLHDESVFEKVNCYNEAQYSGFSRMLRGAFDDALPYFADASIDLLHIDGLNSYEAVSHNFQVWLPKLSARAIVLIHDINVRDGKFGVFKFFETLKEKYPAIEFAHGNGLGVLSVGPAQNELLQRLFDASGNGQARQATHEVFSRLGRACADSFAAAQQQEQARRLSEEVEEQKTELARFQQKLEKAHSDFGDQSRHLSETIARMQTQLEQHAVERGQLAERVALLQEIRAELKEETNRYQGRIVSISGEFAEKSNQLATLIRQATEHEQTIAALSERIKTEVRANAELSEKLQDRESTAATEVERLTLLMRAQAESLQSALTREKSLEDQVAELTRKVTQRDEEIAAAKSSAKQAQLKYLALHQQSVLRESELTAFKRSQEERDSKAEQLQQELTEQSRFLDEALAELLVRDENVAQLNLQIAGQVAEQESVKAQLAREDAARHELHLQILALQAEKEELVKSNEERFQELATLTRLLEERDAGLQSRDKEVRLRPAGTLDVELKALTEALKAAEDRLAEAEARIGSAQTQKEAALAGLEDENKHLKNEQLAQAEMLDHRSTELASLTRLLEERKAGLQAKEHEAALQQQRADRLDNQLKQIAGALRIAEKQLADAETRSSTIQSQQEAALDSVEAENKALRKEQQVLGRKLDDRFRELAILTKLIEEREQAAEVHKDPAVQQPLQKKIVAPFVTWSAEFKRLKIIKKQVSIMEKSGLFDESWYLSQYPDVAATQTIKAGEHYLLFGAAEGRNPGPAFNTNAYAAKHPEISEIGINPLLHYIQHEKKTR